MAPSTVGLGRHRRFGGPHGSDDGGLGGVALLGGLLEGAEALREERVRGRGVPESRLARLLAELGQLSMLEYRVGWEGWSQSCISARVLLKSPTFGPAAASGPSTNTGVIVGRAEAVNPELDVVSAP